MILQTPLFRSGPSFGWLAARACFVTSVSYLSDCSNSTTLLHLAAIDQFTLKQAVTLACKPRIIWAVWLLVNSSFPLQKLSRSRPPPKFCVQEFPHNLLAGNNLSGTQADSLNTLQSRACQ